MPNKQKITDMAVSSVTAWYDEKTKAPYNFDYPGYQDPAGHFTQVVWKSSRKLGVGVVTIDETSDGDKGHGVYVVARYDPAGNIDTERQFRENVLKDAASPPKNKQIIPINGEPIKGTLAQDATDAYYLEADAHRDYRIQVTADPKWDVMLHVNGVEIDDAGIKRGSESYVFHPTTSELYEVKVSGFDEKAHGPYSLTATTESVVPLTVGHSVREYLPAGKIKEFAFTAEPHSTYECKLSADPQGSWDVVLTVNGVETDDHNNEEEKATFKSGSSKKEVGVDVSGWRPDDEGDFVLTVRKT